MAVVYANTEGVVIWSQGQSPLTKGEAWDSEADLVRERPDLFDEEPTLVRGRRVPVEETPVERATSRPGEKRPTRRTRG